MQPYQQFTNKCFNALAEEVASETDFRKACNHIINEITLARNNSREKLHAEALAYYSAANNLGSSGDGDANLREQVRKDLLKFRGEEEVDFTPLPKKKKQSFDTMHSMWAAHNADEGGEDRDQDEGEERKRGAVAMAQNMLNIRNKTNL